MRISILLLCSLLLFSCATKEVVEQPEFTIQSNKVLLLPTTSMQPGIEASCLTANDQIKMQLMQHHFDIVTVDQAVYDKASRFALESTGTIYNPKLKMDFPYDRALYIRALINALKTTYHFDVLIDSEIILRAATLQKQTVQWDGLEKKIMIKNQPKGIVLPQEAMGISLRLAAYTSLGGLIKLEYAGMALPYDIDYRQGYAQFILKKQFFVGNDIKSAVKRALEPFYSNVVVINEKD